MDWYLEPGDRIARTKLHDDFGGSRQSGISPSRRSDNILIFSDPSVGEGHGYIDRWNDDNTVFHYAGEGQTGDQQMVRGNHAIYNHRNSGKALRVFWGAGGIVEYAGEFELAEDDPYEYIDAKETHSYRLRKVIRFRLVPNGHVETPDARRPARKLVKAIRPLTTPYRPANETAATPARDPFTVDPNAVDRGLIGHAATQNRLADAVGAAGHRPLSPGPGDPDFDLAWEQGGTLVVAEVKSLTATNETGQLRLGLGQVLDYQDRLAAGGRTVRAVLAVEKEPGDLRWVALCRRHDVTLVWPATFARALSTRPGWHYNDRLDAWYCDDHQRPRCDACATGHAVRTGREPTLPTSESTPGRI